MAGLLEIFVFFIVIYFIMSVLRLAYRNVRPAGRGGRPAGTRPVDSNPGGGKRARDNDKVIELDKDQYRVE
jgi:hypothetical protein